MKNKFVICIILLATICVYMIIAYTDTDYEKDSGADITFRKDNIIHSNKSVRQINCSMLNDVYSIERNRGRIRHYNQKMDGKPHFSIHEYAPININPGIKRGSESRQININGGNHTVKNNVNFDKDRNSSYAIAYNQATGINIRWSTPSDEPFVETGRRYGNSGNPFPPFPNDPAPIGDGMLPLSIMLAAWCLIKLRKQKS